MVNKKLLKEVMSKKYLLALLASAMFNGIFIVINSYLLASIVDAVFLQHVDLVQIKSDLYLLVLNAALKALTYIATEYFIKSYSEERKESIRRRSFAKLLSANPLRVKEQKTGEIVNLLNNGVEMITPYFSQYLPQFAASVVIPLLILLATAFVDRLSALIMLITYPIIPLFMILIGGKSKELNEKQWSKLNLLSAHFLDMLQGIVTLKIFGRSRAQEKKVFEVSERYRKATMKVLRVSFLSAMVLETAATISAAMIAVNLGLHLVYGKIDFAPAFFVLIMAPEFYLPIRQLGLKFHASLNGEVAIHKIASLEKELHDNPWCGDVVLPTDSVLCLKAVNLCFVQGDRDILKDIHFNIKKGQKVALVGRSGGGKSTLLNILCGMQEVNKGMLFVDGVDICSIGKESYIDRIAIVPQHSHIFYKSMKENITLGSDNQHDDILTSIARRTKIVDLTKSFQNGIDTVIGQGAKVQISGGEKQRIAAARALMKNADIVILDEPTSALDSETEEMLLEFIEQQLQGKTVIIAAHRLRTIKNADQILVLENGTVAEAGVHQDLMQQKGGYYQMVSALEDAI